MLPGRRGEAGGKKPTLPVDSFDGCHCCESRNKGNDSP